MKWILRTLVAIALGALVSPLGGWLGWQLGAAWVRGALTQWQRLPSLPTGAQAITGGSTDAVQVSASDGNTYQCLPGSDSCWTPTSGNEQLVAESPDCTGDFGWYSSIAAPPQGTIDYLKTRWCLPGLAAAETDYAVNQDGSVWYWHQMDGEMMPVFRLLAPTLVGIVIGFIMGVVLTLVLLMAWDRRRATGTPASA